MLALSISTAAHAQLVSDELASERAWKERCAEPRRARESAICDCMNGNRSGHSLLEPEPKKSAQQCLAEVALRNRLTMMFPPECITADLKVSRACLESLPPTSSPPRQAPSAGQLQFPQPPPLRSQPMSSEEISSLAEKSVYVVVVAKGSQSAGLGAAVAVGPNDLLTACHVVADASSVAIGHPTWERKWIGVYTVIAEGPFDRCWLRITNQSLGNLHLETVSGVREWKDLKRGERAYTLGHPIQLLYTFTGGTITALRRHVDGMPDQNWIQFDAAASPGNSGGALFDGYGNLIGIVDLTVNIEHSQNLNFAIAVDEFWPKPQSLGKVGEDNKSSLKTNDVPGPAK